MSIYKRFTSYKATGVEWVPEVPESWAAVPLSRLLAVPVTDGPHDTPSFLDEGVPFLSVDGIQDGELVLPGTRFISFEDHGRFAVKARPQRDDILMGKAASIGKIARVKADVEFNIWSPLALIRVHPAKAPPAFVEYTLKSHWLQAQIETKANLNTQFNLGMKDISKLLVISAPQQDASAIVEVLDRETARIDSLIVKKTRFIELLREKRQALITQAVTRGLNPNATMKDSGVAWLGQVPANWSITRLRYLASLNPGTGTRPEALRQAEVSFLPMECIGEDGQLDLSTIRRKEDVNVGYSYFENDDVAFAKVTPCFENGKGALFRGLHGGVGYGTTELTVLRSKGQAMPAYLNLLVKSSHFRGLGAAAMTGAGGLKRVPDEFTRNFPVPLPDLAEQEFIVTEVEKQTERLDRLVARCTESVRLLRERRSALITAAVTGQIDLRPEAAEEATGSA